ncbi:hypothetical protein EW026_g6937 [Hermanssonia centrifuga]|uniref:Pheromone receptor n=1 Tax=Hermanssonia centrifuga TaxID=98765 RepID=A0A4S4K9F9_9APHY|nr:hypothetical protein EW026_g6937 [Hermanssonia centrifuga]
MRYPLMPIAGAFVAAILVLIPLGSHWRARNVATLSMITWLFLINMIYGINALVWAGNVDIKTPVWCDITTKLIIGASSAFPAAALCICKYLEMVASGRVVRLTSIDHRRRMIFEVLLCVGVPVTLMVLHYIVQGHRFDIIEDFGCQPATYISVPAVFIVWFPPLFLSAITLIYAGLRPWNNWADVHSDWLRIDQYTLDEFYPSFIQQMLVLWWSVPATALIFFVFFGFGEESRKDYKYIVDWVMKTVFRRNDRRAASMLDSWPDSNGCALLTFSVYPLLILTFSSGTRRIVIHKLSTVDINKDDMALPAYSPASASSSNFYVASKEDAKQPPTSSQSFPVQTLPNLARAPSRSSSTSSDSRRSSRTSFSMSILDEYPVSEPSTPVSFPRVPSPPNPADEYAYPVSPVYHRPFSPPTVHAVPAQELPSEEFGGVHVTVETQSHNIV